jgi:hypothetical protein
MSSIIPIPRCDVNVRLAMSGDLPFIDSLQKLHKKQVGFLATSWIESRIAKKQVLVAEESVVSSPSSVATDHGPRTTDNRLGYIISQDKYLKRDELGIVIQLCVVPGSQRKLVGATLLKAAFERAAYGCLLFCCWCAQDIEANRFWESMGFVPLAFRAGSEKKSRVHIFWQKRIREGDVETKWWYPCETTGGAMNEGRIVFPIPPDRHWAEEMPVILPRAEEPKKALPGPRKAKAPAPPKRRVISRAMMLRFADVKEPAVKEKTPREKRPKATCPERSRRKNDPQLVAMAREFRDRWLERLNAGEMLLTDSGKYDVSRALPSAPTSLKALPQAA